MRKTIPSFILFFCFLVAGVNAVAAKPVMLTSPDGNIVFTFTLNNHQPAYSIVYKKNPLINNSPLVLLFDDGNAFASSVISNKPVSHKETNDYKLIIGKTTAVHDVCNTTIISLTGNYKVNIEVKVFNDGVAFRYTFPPQQKKQFLLKEERTAFSLNGDPIVKALLLPNYITSHEGLYRTAALSEMPSDSLMDMPALFQAGKTFIAITEASLLDYAGMYLIKHGGNMEGILSPLPGTNGVKVKGSFPHQSPWRVMMISDRMGALLESNILTTLCEPTKFTETSWIKPGLTTFPWWNGTVIPDTSFAPGNNFQTNQYYIDFCAANNVRYHTIVEAGGHEWYTNDGTGYQPGKNADVTKPVDGLDMKAICDYAHAKNVGVRVWVHWKALYPQLDSAFAIFEKWGLSGMMVDFMDRDDQEMVNIQKEILEKAARHHLHIQFHGAYKPTGLHRTYPNEFTREGTLNYENDKWNNLVTPDADLDIAVTRLLAGSTDYHLGGFRASSFENFKVRYTRPLVIGTRCHMLAMYVVFENYQGMLCDDPTAYIGQPGFELLQQMPVTWDESKVPAAIPGEYVSIARRKGERWYLGTITNHDGRTVTPDLAFLGEGQYKAIIYSDGPNILQNANDIKKQEMLVDKTSKLTLQLSAGGGNVVVLSKLLN